jgi:hypothetical protein
MTTAKFLGNKESHGDLDLLCAWEGGKIGEFWKESDSGRIGLGTSKGCPASHGTAGEVSELKSRGQRQGDDGERDV